MQNSLPEITELLRSRRSVLVDQFEAGAHVDDHIIEQALENATWAPNHGRAEPWRFTVFTGEGLQRLAQEQAAIYKEASGENFKEPVYQKLLSNPLKASHVIAICLKRSENKNIPQQEDIAAVACAVQNLHLTIHAAGFGGYWTTGGITYRPQGKQMFGLGEEDLLLGFFYIGKIAVPSAPGKRAAVEERVTWVRE